MCILFLLFFHWSDSTYTSQVRSFLQWYREFAHVDSTLILMDSVATRGYDPSFAEFLSDTTDLTNVDRAELKSQIGRQPLTVWTTDLLGTAHLMTGDTVRVLFGLQSGQNFKHTKDAWKYFYWHYGHELYNFSAPVFLHHYTLCLFYCGGSCGLLCGGGGLCLYKKVGNKWIFVTEFSHWVS